jgi:protein-tyrosine sulfotransferase
MAGPSLRVRLANRTERMRQRSWRMAGRVSSARHVVMGGAPRSGTTLLRRIFDHHPGICAGPETKLFVPAAFNLEWLSDAYAIPLDELRSMRDRAASQTEFIDAFARRVLDACGKPRWAEKTPMNIRNLDWITRHFPKASIVHIVRDGRDVVCSMRQHPDWRWNDGAWEKVLVPRPLETYARRWVADTAAGMRWRGDRRYVEVRYEDLVASPVLELERICAAIGEQAEASWLESVARPEEDGSGAVEGFRPDDKGAISATSIGRWRQELVGRDREVVERICGPRLRELGYAV